MPDLVAAFLAQAQQVGATATRARPERLVERVVGLLEAHGCASVSVADAVAERGAIVAAAVAAGLLVIPPGELWPTRRADGGVSWARLGVAESGSLLLHSSSQDRRVELCVDVHLVLIETGALVATLDQAFAVLRDLSARSPAYASLVSGPSRSADIERTLTIGVHGPRVLEILLLESGH